MHSVSAWNDFDTEELGKMPFSNATLYNEQNRRGRITVHLFADFWDVNISSSFTKSLKSAFEMVTTATSHKKDKPTSKLIF